MNIESFLRYLRYEKNYSSCTVLSYRNDLLQFVDYRQRSRNDADSMPVESDDVRNWVMSLSEQGLSARTIGRKISTLRSYYRYALGRGEVDVSPVANIKLPKASHRLPAFARPEAMARLLDGDHPEGVDSFLSLRDHLIIEMLYETGVRRAELISLTDRAVDDRACEIRVIGKRNKERIIPYGEKLRDEIVRYRKIRQVVAGETHNFFVRENGKPLYPGLVYRIVHRALQSAMTLPKSSPHVLRHSFASALLNNGAGINSVKELLGHSSLASTEVYTHITFEELKQYYKHAHPRALKKGGDYGD